MADRSIFRPRSSEDWQGYRQVIEGLYLDHQLKLKDVKEIMERDYGFVASEKQYKDRLAAWKARKNIKAREAYIMLRKQRRRSAQGKHTAFRIGGQEVDMKKARRSVRRSRTDLNVSESSPEPETPSDMSYYTPPDRPSTPATQTPDDDSSFSPPSSVPYYEDVLPDVDHPDITGFHSQPLSGESWESLFAFQGRLLDIDREVQARLSQQSQEDNIYH